MVLTQVNKVVIKTNPEYNLVIKRLHLYYGMKPVILDIIVHFPGFFQLYNQSPLTLYQIKIIPVPILDQNVHPGSYTGMQVFKPYVTHNNEIYISLRHQELHSCKHICFDFYCGELFCKVEI